MILVIILVIAIMEFSFKDFILMLIFSIFLDRTLNWIFHKISFRKKKKKDRVPVEDTVGDV